MAARASMTSLITKVRKMIADLAGENQQFDDETIEEYLDENRVDQRYETLMIASSIVNNVNTNGQAQTVFADYYSRFKYWDQDTVIQGNDVTNNNAWIVLTPTTSDYLTGHWTFEDDVFVSGSAPGQYPPIFATGRTYDPFLSAAQLLEIWAATLTCAYDFSVNGRSFHRSQMLDSKLKLAQTYRQQAKTKVGKMIRPDINPTLATRRMRLLDSDDVVRFG